jgi:histidinol-phosphate/aromatic aminotransferase/cobyric acid decarboxylase-like protein/GTP:adenosylcobinamide-phosphate guanylyltransferase
MDAILLAAGLGRRMLPLTAERHKSLLPIGETTILGRIVDGLRALPVRDTLVVTGYREGEIRDFLASRYPDMRFRFVHNARYAETNNVVSLAMAFEHTHFDDDVLVIETDVLFDPALLGRLAARRGNAALLDHFRPGMDGTVVSVDEGVVTGVFPPHVQGPDFSYDDKYKTLNLYRFDRQFCRDVFRPLLSLYAQEIDDRCYYELVLGMLVNAGQGRVHAELVDGAPWAEVDDPNDLAAARFVFEPERRLQILERTKGGYWNFDVLDFAHLRNLHFPTDAMVASMKKGLSQFIRGYGSAQTVLDEKLATFLFCRPERVKLLSGASQAFPLLAEILRARAPLLPSPTFGEWPRRFPPARIYRDAPGIAWAEIASALDGAAADLVVLVNPNNPTGTLLPSAWIHALAAAHPATRFLVDESFLGFSDESSLVRHLEERPLDNVVVLSSLSKTLGVPGLRLGYLYACDARLIAEVDERLPIWNLGALSEFFLELLLKFRSELEASLGETRRDRAELTARLTGCACVREVHPSGGNFLLVTLDGDGARAAQLTRALTARHRIYVKDVSARFADGAARLRLAVRVAADHQRLCEALETTWT